MKSDTLDNKIASTKFDYNTQFVLSSNLAFNDDYQRRKPKKKQQRLPTQESQFVNTKNLKLKLRLQHNLMM